MTPELFKLLTSVDTPTVCNAIEVAQGQRGFSDFTRGTMLCSNVNTSAIVGYARTAQIAATEPSKEPKDVIRARRMAYYKHMSTVTEGLVEVPSIAVIEDMDYPHAIGAYWGEVNTNIHKAFGMSGALTNGVMRDLGDMAENFTVIAGSIGPSHGFVHVKTVGEPVEIFGMRVRDNDLIHADRHGAIVIPRSVIGGLEAAINKLLRTEKIVLEPTYGKRITFEEFEHIWASFEAART
ncbi:RraA family protein [Lentilitoribacter sp. EG35]|uniref:RraA family protein n=1 Tax=Lentilitoribacter sp. EG35 TaxID=3234192 RepID=UPI00346107BD